MEKAKKEAILNSVGSAIDSADATVTGSRDSVVSAYENTKSAAVAKAEEAKVYAQKAHKNAQKVVAENPEKAVLGAAAIGLAVGVALTVILTRRK